MGIVMEKLKALSLSELIDVRRFVEVWDEKLCRIAEKLRCRREIDTVKAVYRFNIDKLRYPFTADGKPSTGFKIEVFPWLRFGSIFKIYLRSWEEDYAWLKPSRLIEVGYGICVDTSNLCTTLLRILGFDAYTSIGVVKPRTGSDRYYGHAWTRVRIDSLWYIIETTIHGVRKLPPLIPYSNGGELAIEYIEAAYFDERKVHVDSELWRRYSLTLDRIAYLDQGVGNTE